VHGDNGALVPEKLGVSLCRALLRGNLVADIDMSSAEPPRRTGEELDGDGKDKGSDWIVGYNPNVQTNLNIDLLHNLNHQSVVCCVKFSADGKYLATGCNKSAQMYVLRF
jgi:general transcriptional corepressor TUP1